MRLFGLIGYPLTHSFSKKYFTDKFEREGLVQEILTQIPSEKIIWEAPQKSQQLYFIELLGCNVNLGNIAPSEVIPLEAMRIGLRGDTFDLFLDKKEA